MADPIYVYVGTYPTEEAADVDYEVFRKLWSDGVVETYDAAVVTKDAEGKVHVSKREKPTQHGAWAGAAVGALVGLIFPPSVLAGAVVGAAAGGLIGHLREGLSRSDLKELGDVISDGQAALVIFAKSELDKVADEYFKSANHVEKKLDKADAKAFEKALNEASKDS